MLYTVPFNGMADYARGFEDACELILASIEEKRDPDEIARKVRSYLGLIKERKFDRIRSELGALR